MNCFAWEINILMENVKNKVLVQTKNEKTKSEHNLSEI